MSAGATAVQMPRATDLVKGRLLEQHAGYIVLGLPGTDYRLHLVVGRPVNVKPGDRVAGRIDANARRVDVAAANRGGAYIEPVFGRPRRLQGRVLATDPAANTITVHCACPLVCKLTDPRQRAEHFAPGMLVMFDVERGARFEQAERE